MSKTDPTGETLGMDMTSRHYWLLLRMPEYGWGATPQQRNSTNPNRLSQVTTTVATVLTVDGLWSADTAVAWVRSDRLRHEVNVAWQTGLAEGREVIRRVLREYPHPCGPVAYAAGVTLEEYLQVSQSEAGRQSLKVLAALTATADTIGSVGSAD